MNKSVQKSIKKRGSKKSRQRAFLDAFVNCNFNISKACKEIGIGRSVVYHRWEKDEHFKAALAEVVEQKLDLIEEALVKKINDGDTTATIFALKTIGKARGYVEGERTKAAEMPAKRTVEILDRLLSKDLDVREAALLLDKEGLPLPESVRALLSKIEPPEPPPDLPPSLDDAELERRYQEGLHKVEEEGRVWLPAREKEIKALKTEVDIADSWTPGAAPNLITED